MSKLRSMVVPDWPKYVPGLLACAVFAWLIMNVDHLLHELTDKGVGWATFLYEGWPMNGWKVTFV